MYSEQLAVLLLIAATQMANQGHHAQPTAQVPRGGVERISLSTQQTSAERRRAKVLKRQREALMVAEVR
jgi:hypothetical protein